MTVLTQMEEKHSPFLWLWSFQADQLTGCPHVPSPHLLTSSPSRAEVGSAAARPTVLPHKAPTAQGPAVGALAARILGAEELRELEKPLPKTQLQEEASGPGVGVTTHWERKKECRGIPRASALDPPSSTLHTAPAQNLCSLCGALQ